MYVITSNGKIRYADSVVPVRLHSNGCYVLVDEKAADGFCAKLAVTATDEDGNEYQALSDTVYHFPGHALKGDEPEGEYTQRGAAILLTEAETALAELEAIYDAG